MAGASSDPFYCTDPGTDRMRCGDRGTGKDESCGCIQSNLGWCDGFGTTSLADNTRYDGSVVHFHWSCTCI